MHGHSHEQVRHRGRGHKLLEGCVTVAVSGGLGVPLQVNDEGDGAVPRRRPNQAHWLTAETARAAGRRSSPRTWSTSESAHARCLLGRGHCHPRDGKPDGVSDGIPDGALEANLVANPMASLVANLVANPRASQVANLLRTTSPMASPMASLVAYPMASPMAYPMASLLANPTTSPTAYPAKMANPKTSGRAYPRVSARAHSVESPRKRGLGRPLTPEGKGRGRVCACRGCCRIQAKKRDVLGGVLR